MKRKIVCFILILAAFLFQTSIWGLLPFGQVKPNLLIALTVSFGFMHGKRSGMYIGFVSGLLIDIFYGEFFGFNALVYMYAGYLTGKLYKVFFDEDIRVPLLLTGAAELGYSIIHYIFILIFRARYNPLAYFRHIVMPELLLTLIVTLLFYRLFYYINRKLTEGEIEEQESPWLLR